MAFASQHDVHALNFTAKSKSCKKKIDYFNLIKNISHIHVNKILFNE